MDKKLNHTTAQFSPERKAKVSIIRDNQALPLIQGKSARSFVDNVNKLNKMAGKVNIQSIVESMKKSAYGKMYSQVN